VRQSVSWAWFVWLRWFSNQGNGPARPGRRTHQRVLDLTKELVGEFQEATQIVGFFDKWDEVARIKRQIKRSILDQPFGDRELVDAVTERFMDLGKRHFR
jgi:type I restriction enzyme R subunit